MRRRVAAAVVAIAAALVLIAVLASGVVFRNEPPTVGVIWPFEALVGKAETFYAHTATDPDGDTLNFTWNFGDGSTAYGRNVSHAYTTHGIYAWVLEVDDGHGHKVPRNGQIQVLADGDLNISVVVMGRCHWDSRFTDYPFLNVTVTTNASFTISIASATFVLKNATGGWFSSVDSPVPSNYSSPKVLTLYPGLDLPWSLMFHNDASGTPVILDYNGWFEWQLDWTGA